VGRETHLRATRHQLQYGPGIPHSVTMPPDTGERAPPNPSQKG